VDQQWKDSFLDKLKSAQSKCAKRFEDAMDNFLGPAFDDVSGFLRDNGFHVTAPLNEEGRRSFKFELSENTYLLMIFRFCGIGEIELRSEIFVPSRGPSLEKAVGRLSDLSEDWALKQFQRSLDKFIQMLGGALGEAAPSQEPELVNA